MVLIRGKRGHYEYQAESVFAIEVEAMETLLADEAERLVERERGGVVEFGFKHDLRA